MLRKLYESISTTLVLGVLMVLSCADVRAQSSGSTSSINGTVTDATGAAVPEAEIVIVNSATGLRQTNRTNSEGLFTFSAVPIGAYDLTASASGFRGVQVTNINASVGQTSSLEVRLEIGSTTQQIEVVASEEILNTSDSTLSSVMGRPVIDNLPSLRRSYTDFVLLMPNVTSDGQYGNLTFAGSGGDSNTRYRNANASTSYSVDGANATSRYLGGQRGQTRIPYLFGAESVQEFQVAESPYSPQYGGGAAGYVNTVTKSGTNALHGAAFYFNRNTTIGGATDAASKAAGIPRALDVRQQFGAAIGGPIKKNKLFFFTDYEQQRRKNPISIINTAQSAVNATSFGLPAGTQLPAPTGYPVPSSLTAPAPGNPIYLQQVSNALYQIQSNLGYRQRRQDDIVLFGKGDLFATEKDQISLHYNYNKFDSPGGASTGNPSFNSGISALGNNYVRDHSALIHWTHTLTPSLVMDTHASYTRDDQIGTPSGLVPAGFSPSVVLNAPSSFSVGQGAYSILREYQWALSEHAVWNRGRHTFDFGGSFNRDSNVSFNLSGYNGSYTFSNLSSFALGQFNLYTQSSGNPTIRIKFPTYAFYAADTFKVTPKLTVNYGLRYDWTLYPQPPLNPAVPLTGRYNNNFSRWAPRVGFAYHVRPRTVIRGGTGMFRAFLTSANFINSTTTNGLSSLRSSLTVRYNNALPPDAQAVTFPNVLPSNSSLFAASPNVTVIDPGLKEPTTIQASLQVEQQLTNTVSVTVGSIWAHSYHLISSSYYDLNLQRPTGTTNYVVCPPGTTVAPCAGVAQVSRPNLDSGLLQEGARFPGIGQVNALISPGNSNYTSGFAQLRQAMSHGFTANFAYTFSKNISQNGTDFYNQFDFSDTKQLDVLDQRHKLTFALVYQTQISGKSLSKSIIRDWMISTSTQYGSGRPYTGVLQSSCIGNSVATCTGGSTLNNSAFNSGGGISRAGPSPNFGLNSFTGPWSGSVDVNLERSFRVGETGKISFRVTGYNLLNHANYFVQSGSGVNTQQYKPIGANCGNRAEQQTCYLIPNNTVGGFGTYTIVQQNTGPRSFQFAFIYRF